MSKGSDRRQFWRAAFHSGVQLVDASGSTLAELVDVSLKGALIKVPPEWAGKIDHLCQIKLRLADDAVIIMRAVVAHVEGRRVGLRCESMDLDSITHLRRLVELNAGDARMLERELAALLMT
ncbi:MAG TPA: PilZ domain-containing protein [Rhodocyclaceae bacterium]|nr:PilZ domain-containing protein [Rhodocyclaceae bacterium]